CVEPLSSSEINAIIRSIAGYMATEGYQRQGGGIVPMPDSMRQALAEMGRKGGLRNSHAQRAARAKGPAAAAAARKRRADDQARQAKHLHRKGHSRAQIAAKLGRAACTISRYLRRWLPLTEAEKRACITGASGERYALAPTTDTLRWTLSSHRPASNNNYRPQRVGPPQYLRWSRRSTNPRHSTKPPRIGQGLAKVALHGLLLVPRRRVERCKSFQARTYLCVSPRIFVHDGMIDIWSGILRRQ